MHAVTGAEHQAIRRAERQAHARGKVVVVVIDVVVEAERVPHVVERAIVPKRGSYAV